MKDKISRISSRAVPYDTVQPRRALREPIGVTESGKIVKRVPWNNTACDYPQTSTTKSVDYCSEEIAPNKYRAFYVEKWEPNPENPNLGGRFWTCAKVACDNNREDIEQNDPVRFSDGMSKPFDTRCFVSRPPLKFTSDSWSHTANRYDGLPGTYEGYVSGPAGYDGAIVDTGIKRCHDGRLNATVAEAIQKEFGIKAAPAPLPAPVSSGLLATAGAGMASIASAYLTPTPTAVIAAAAPSATVGGLAASLAFVGAAAAFGGVAYGGYKFKEYLARHPFQNSGHSLEEAIEFDQKAQILDGLPTYEEAVADSQT